MKLTRIRQVKKEIRVLGLSVAQVGNKNLIVGVVFRGMQSIDGVLCCSSTSNDFTSAAECMIKDSNHFNQIRLIVVDMDQLPPRTSIDLDALASRTCKPVLGLTKAGGQLDDRYMFLWRGLTVTSMGLRKSDAEKVLETCSVEDFPEALRIATLISEELSGTSLHKV